MVDQLDLKILETLRLDASLPFTEIAKRFKISESTVRKRVERLIREGVIKKFTVTVNPAKIGFNTVAIVGVDVDPSKLLEVAQKLCEIPETVYVATSTGDHMIMTEIWTRDGRELTRILSEKIGSIEGVKRFAHPLYWKNLRSRHVEN